MGEPKNVDILDFVLFVFVLIDFDLNNLKILKGLERLLDFDIERLLDFDIGFI
jgi:hypothetical protein